MTHDTHLLSEGWADYELLDSGEGAKLERFGNVILARPETQALWEKRQPARWKEAQATFSSDEGKGTWERKRGAQEKWQMSRGPLRFTAKLTQFKHVGVFPEQEPNWVWVKDRIKTLLPQAPGANVHILNLFGYTGIATLAAAHAGAKVTHVDASKQVLTWARENAQLSGLADDAVRWLPDDALVFSKREVRRGARYDGIILDPPAFGRGVKGEVWHIERDLPTLLTALTKILSQEKGSFFLLSSYAAGYAPRSIAQTVESAFGPTTGESGELHLKESGSSRVIPSGTYCRFVR